MAFNNLTEFLLAEAEYDPNYDVEKFNAMAVEHPLGIPDYPKVFIANKSGHDFSQACRYGRPEYVTQGLVNRFSVGHMARKWMSCLVRSSPRDYILVTSLTILTVTGAAIFGWLHGRINLLLFRNNKYIARTVIFQDLLDATKEDSYESTNKQ